MELEYPFAERPAPGELQEVGPGIYWLCMPIETPKPSTLDHINIWLLEDGESWTVVDTGFKSDGVEKIWRGVFDDQLKGLPVGRIIVTHMHPDHVGQAGWIARHWNAELWMTRAEYLLYRLLSQGYADSLPPEVEAFYRDAGYGDEFVANAREAGWGNYSRAISEPLRHFRPILDGEVFKIGDHDWQVNVGRGHTVEHACLHAAGPKMLISGDQVLPRITPNISVMPMEPDEDPLSQMLDSWKSLRAVPDDTLILPAHGDPFYGLHAQLEYFLEHHEAKLNRLAEFCAEPRSAREVLPVLFKRELQGFHIFLALGEAVAHLNCLLNRGRIVRERRTEGGDLYRKV